MQKNKLILLTGNNDFFGQTRKPWVSMDVRQMIRVFEQHGFEVEKYSFHQIANQDRAIHDSFIFYTFHQKLNRRNYLKDVVRFLDDGTNILIPNYDLLLCHENKGYQELYKKRIGLSSLQGYYFSSEQELADYPIQYPVVLKSVDTSNGKGVFLAHDPIQLKKLIRKLEKQSLLVKLDLLRRKYFRRKKTYKEYPDYSNRTDYFQYRDYILKERNFILQQFVPGLTTDFRVLIFFDKYFVMRRHAKKDDFRASGTKIQEYDIEVDERLLEFASQVYAKFDTPFLSLDIGGFQDKFYLFEFQALHFGINVVIKTKGYYQRRGEHWQFIPSKAKIEHEIAGGLIKYLRHRHG